MISAVNSRPLSNCNIRVAPAIKNTEKKFFGYQHSFFGTSKDEDTKTLSNAPYNEVSIDTIRPAMFWSL